VWSGSQSSFWHDKWHPTGYLLDCFGSRAVHDSGIPFDAKVSKIIKGGDWYWPFARSNSIVENVGYLRFLLEVWIWLFGTLPMVLILVQLLGINCE
jgi:hypothetical protein